LTSIGKLRNQISNYHHPNLGLHQLKDGENNMIWKLLPKTCNYGNMTAWIPWFSWLKGNVAGDPESYRWIEGFAFKKYNQVWDFTIKLICSSSGTIIPEMAWAILMYYLINDLINDLISVFTYINYNIICIYIIYYVYIDVETLSHRGTISWLKPLPTARRHQLRDIATWDPADPSWTGKTWA
jgi:hypothetical protein